MASESRYYNWYRGGPPNSRHEHGSPQIFFRYDASRADTTFGRPYNCGSSDDAMGRRGHYSKSADEEMKYMRYRRIMCLCVSIILLLIVLVLIIGAVFLALFLPQGGGTGTDPCANVICGNGGTCQEGTCDCAPGFAGSRCETDNTVSVNGVIRVLDEPFTSSLLDPASADYQNLATRINANVASALGLQGASDFIDARVTVFGDGSVLVFLIFRFAPVVTNAITRLEDTLRTRLLTANIDGLVVDSNYYGVSSPMIACGQSCNNRGTCLNLSNGGVICSCSNPYSGTFCQDVHQCTSTTCQYGGTCQQGTGTYTCQCADGFTGTNCEIEVKCGSPENGTNTESVSVTEGNPEEAYNYTCSHGFTLDPHNLMVFCQLNDEGNVANWSPIPPTCSEVKCGSPGNGTNTESVSVTEGNPEEAYNYTCSHGFTLDPHNLTVVCQLNTKGTIANWSPIPPTCSEVKCGPPGNGTNTESVSVTEGNPEEAYNYTCSRGFTLDPTNLTVVCQLNTKGNVANWSPIPPTCSEVKCGSPGNGTNTESVSVTEGNPEEAYNYTCSYCFTLDPANLTVVCQLNDEGTIASWFPIPPTCSEVKCGPPGAGILTNSVAISEACPGETYTYECTYSSTRFTPTSTATVVCQMDKKGNAFWSHSPPECYCQPSSNNEC